MEKQKVTLSPDKDIVREVETYIKLLTKKPKQKNEQQTIHKKTQKKPRKNHNKILPKQ